MMIQNKSVLTGKVHVMDLDVTEEQIQSYLNGTLLQRAFPHLTPAERDFIKLGVTPEEWDEHFGKFEDD